jgi:hypothetical protein
MLHRVWRWHLVAGLGDDLNHREEVECQLAQARAELVEAWLDAAPARADIVRVVADGVAIESARLVVIEALALV